MRIVRCFPLFALLVACSGASSTELFDDPPSGSSDGTLPAASSAPSASASSTAASPPQTPPPVTTPGGTTANDPCTPEEEPNDSPDLATPMKSCIAGKIGTRGDVDYAQFDPPIDATRLSYSVTSKDGNVAVRVLMDGDIPVGGPNGDVPVAPGVSYVVEVRLASGDSTARPTYQVKIAYK